MYLQEYVVVVILVDGRETLVVLVRTVVDVAIIIPAVVPGLEKKIKIRVNHTIF